MLIVLLLLTVRYFPYQRVGGLSDTKHWKRAVLTLVALAAAWNISTVAFAVIRTVKTGEIRLDQGQSVYRAALELRKGRNPYGQGALLDIDAYRSRMGKRVAVGLAPTVPAPEVEVELDRYWKTLDPAIREKLLPVVPKNAPESARREASVLGYRYGPVPLLVTASLAPMLGPAAVPLTGGMASLALFVVIALTLKGADIGVTGGGLAVSAVMIDPWITFSYILSSASDVWALLFGFAALLCAVRRWRGALGLCLGLAVGGKLFPGILYLPLLMRVRSVRAALAFGTAIAALFLPWIIWDARALFYNFSWPALVDADSTSWVYYTSKDIVIPVRVMFGALTAFLIYRLISGQERRWAWVLAAVSVGVVAVGPIFHNNYIPWFSVWVVLAIAEAFCLQGSGLLRNSDPGRPNPGIGRPATPEKSGYRPAAL